MSIWPIWKNNWNVHKIRHKNTFLQCNSRNFGCLASEGSLHLTQCKGFGYIQEKCVGSNLINVSTESFKITSCLQHTSYWILIRTQTACQETVHALNVNKTLAWTSNLAATSSRPIGGWLTGRKQKKGLNIFWYGYHLFVFL